MPADDPPADDQPDSLELLGALHHALGLDPTFADTAAWRQRFAEIRAAVEADPATDRYDRETLDVIERKLGSLIAEIEAGTPAPDFTPARTWVAALGTSVHRRRSAATKQSGKHLN